MELPQPRHGSEGPGPGTASSLPFHCLFTAFSLPLHSPFTASALPLRRLFTVLFTTSSPPLHRPLHSLFTVLFTAALQPANGWWIEVNARGWWVEPHAEVRHCLCLAFPLPLRLRRCHCLAGFQGFWVGYEDAETAACAGRAAEPWHQLFFDYLCGSVFRAARQKFTAGSNMLGQQDYGGVFKLYTGLGREVQYTAWERAIRGDAAVLEDEVPDLLLREMLCSADGNADASIDQPEFEFLLHAAARDLRCGTQPTQMRPLPSPIRIVTPHRAVSRLTGGSCTEMKALWPAQRNGRSVLPRPGQRRDLLVHPRGGRCGTPTNVDYNPTRRPLSPRIVMRCAPRASNGPNYPNHLGLCALQRPSGWPSSRGTVSAAGSSEFTASRRSA